MLLGSDQLTQYLDRHHPAARCALLCHQASVTRDGTPTSTLLHDHLAERLCALFAPEHGFSGTAPDMAAVGTAIHSAWDIPIYSLYGKDQNSLYPTPQMLQDIDCLIIDLQDIGTRYYTYIYTMALTMRAAAQAGVKVIVCDRPNPINGVTLEGSLGDDAFHSFVGYYPLPVRHGLTIGELALYFNRTYSLGADLHVLRLQGWNRNWYWEDTKLAWINPSPNMRSPQAALLYPGVCLLEGTNVSEGRGTDTPFEVCGAPWINGEVLANKLHYLQLPGIDFHPVTFTPQSRKFAGEVCGGVRLQITDRDSFMPYHFGLALLWTLATIHVATENPCEFGWRTPRGNPPHHGLDAGPYEFNQQHPAIDLLTRDSKIRSAIDAHMPWLMLRQFIGSPTDHFLQQRANLLLY